MKKRNNSSQAPNKQSNYTDTKFSVPRPKGIDENSMEYYVNTDGVKHDHWDPNQGAFHHDVAVQTEPYNRNGYITKVDGVDAYSQPPSLYKGDGQIREGFVPQPGLDIDTGKMHPGVGNIEPGKTYVERDKFGFPEYPNFPEASKHPNISPNAGYNGKSTTYHGAIHTTYRDLKRALNTGLGARTNKYLLELNMPVHKYVESGKLNILCQTASLPQRNMHTASVWRFGRKYNLRGETDFGGTWTVTFLDDSELLVRRAFDDWMHAIDDSKLQQLALGARYNSVSYTGRAVNLDEPSLKMYETVYSRNGEYDLTQQNNYAYSAGFKPLEFDKYGHSNYEEYNLSRPNYQTDIRIYQLDQTGNKVAGYVIQNAFPSSIDAMEYADSTLDELVKTTITFTFSEFLPLKDEYLNEAIGVSNF